MSSLFPFVNLILISRRLREPRGHLVRAGGTVRQKDLIKVLMHGQMRVPAAVGVSCKPWSWGRRLHPRATHHPPHPTGRFTQVSSNTICSAIASPKHI